VREWKDPISQNEGRTGTVKYAGTYPTIIEGRWYENYPAESLPKSGRNLYYVEGGKRTATQNQVRDLLSDKAIIVCLTTTRAKKFKRLFPHARDGKAAATKGAEGWFKKLSKDQRTAIALEYYWNWKHSSLKALPAEQVDDPELSRLLRLYPLWNETTLATMWEQRCNFLSRPTLVECDVSGWEKTYKQYPVALSLAEYEIQRNLNHVLLYINAVYAANNEEVE